MQSKNALLLMLFLLIASLVACSVEAGTENFAVPPETKVTKPLNLQEDDRVAISFTVIGQTTSALDFYITDPSGKIVIQHESAGQRSFSLHAKTSGVYTFHFDNACMEEKMVTLNYDVQHYILGIPQTFFYVLVIAVISVIGIAFFVLLGKSSY